MSRLSVVVPSYNSYLTVEQTIGSLLKQPESLVGEVIVVDSSDDGRTEAVLKTFLDKRFRLIRLEQKTMPGPGRNIGARAAHEDILAFIDSDAYVADDWAERIMDATKAGCRVGGGSLLLPDFQKSKKIAVAQYYLQFNEFLPWGSRRKVMFVPSANLFCEKRLFDKVGGFPDIRASEDVIFCLKAGKESDVFFDPAARIYHIFREDKTAYLNNQKMLGEYILIYRRDYGKEPLFQGVWPLLLLPVIVTVKGLRIVLRVAQRGGLKALGSLMGCFYLFSLGLAAWGQGFAGAWRRKN